jgi:hypothetical protein
MQTGAEMLITEETGKGAIEGHDSLYTLMLILKR